MAQASAPPPAGLLVPQNARESGSVEQSRQGFSIEAARQRPCNILDGSAVGVGLS
jgi:hypothetical protein